MTRPTITENAELAFAPFGAGIKPDGTDESMRILIEPDGFHFEAYDFDDLVLPSIALKSPIGSEYRLSFDDTGALLINGVKYIAPTNNKDESIAGNKIFTGLTSLDGGLQMTSQNGTKYKVVVDDEGVVTTRKEV